MRRSTLLTLSAVVHVGAAIGLGAIQVEERREATSIELANVPNPPQKAETKPPPAPPPPPPSRPRSQPRPQVPLEPLPQEALKAFEDLPDFGFALAGSVGQSGIAVPIRPAHASPLSAPIQKLVAAPVVAGSGPCRTPPAKPKPLHVPRPEYPGAAIVARAEGRVRLELQVGPAGEVLSVRVLQGLGHGLDEAAVAAARRARFEPAQHCGKAMPGRFTIAMRFSAS